MLVKRSMLWRGLDPRASRMVRNAEIRGLLEDGDERREIVSDEVDSETELELCV